MAAAVIYNQSVVERVSSLPLLTSTYDLVSSAYTNTKSTHPYIKSVCEAAEQSVWTITAVARTTASPIIHRLEPQIAIVNDLACKGLDKIEKSFPILHQPSEQIVSSAKGVVSGTKDMVTSSIAGAKGTVSHTLTSAVASAVAKTRGAVQGRVERTRAAASTVGQLVSSGVDTALTASESMVEHYLPLTEEELELEAQTTNCDKMDLSYPVRLGHISTKFRKRVSTKALAKIRDGKQRSLGYISALSSTVDLIEFGRKNIGGANQIINEKLNSLVGWRSDSPDQNGHDAEVIESRTLALAHSLSQKLHTTSLTYASNLQGLPNNVQQEVLSMSRSATQVYANFSKAKVLGDLSDGVLSNTKTQLTKMKVSFDNVMDYLVNNTPMNWLVGPFYPRMVPEVTQPTPAPSRRSTPMEVQMESLDSSSKE